MNTRIRHRILGEAALVMLAASLTYGCKDFLNQPAQGTLTEDVLASKAGVEGLLIAAYRSMDCSNSSGAWGCAASNWVWASVPSGDAYKGSNAGDQQPINDIETYHWGLGEADAYINQKWAQVYEGTSRANAAIRLLDKVLKTKPSEIGSADANGIRGEAIFLRAHYQFEAYRMWGNIPYYRSGDTTDFRKTNQGVDALAEILTDLDSAIALLPPTPRVAGDKGRATSWTAKAYKGKVQVYKGDYAGAVTTLTDVVNNGPFALETSFDHVWTAFANYQDGPETILAYQASVRDGEPNGENANFGERLNFPYSGSPASCCGFHQPSQNLVNFYQVDANGLPLALSDPTWNARDSNFVAGKTQAVDPRLDWTVSRDKVPYKDWGLYSVSWVRDIDYSGPYSPKKNVDEQAADGQANVGWVPTQTNDVHIHILRFADVKLLLAEADIQTGNLASARTQINDIRARAGQTAQGCGLPVDATAAAAEIAVYPTCAGNTELAHPLTLAAGTYSWTAPWAVYRIGLYPAGAPYFDTPAHAMTVLQYERRLELALEGQRFFDMRRWGGADTVIANYLAVEKNRRPYLGLAATFTLPKYQWYPIPSLQIELSKVGGASMLQQNPGW
jgi:hypothetical protein